MKILKRITIVLVFTLLVSTPLLINDKIESSNIKLNKKEKLFTSNNNVLKPIEDTIKNVDFRKINSLPKGRFKTYISKTNTEYSVGDTIKFKSVSEKGDLVHLENIDALGNSHEVILLEGHTLVCVIKSMRVVGTFKNGLYVRIKTKKVDSSEQYFVYLD